MPDKSMDIVVVSGARTPMAEWIGGKRGDGQPGGALAPVSAIDLGAIAAKGAMERAGIEPATIDHVVMGNALQTSGDALYGARHVALKAGIPRDRSGAHCEPAVRLGHAERRDGGPADPDGRGDVGARGRHGEHEPGAARRPRRARRVPARPGTARGLADGRVARTATAASSWRRPPTTSRASTASRARPGRVRASLALAGNKANTNGRFAEESFRCRSCRARRRRPSTRTTTSSPARRSRGWASCLPRSAPSRSSPPATRRASSMAPPRWW